MPLNNHTRLGRMNFTVLLGNTLLNYKQKNFLFSLEVTIKSKEILQILDGKKDDAKDKFHMHYHYKYIITFKTSVGLAIDDEITPERMPHRTFIIRVSSTP